MQINLLNHNIVYLKPLCLLPSTSNFTCIFFTFLFWKTRKQKYKKINKNKMINFFNKKTRNLLKAKINKRKEFNQQKQKWNYTYSNQNNKIFKSRKEKKNSSKVIFIFIILFVMKNIKDMGKRLFLKIFFFQKIKILKTCFSSGRLKFTIALKSVKSFFFFFAWKTS